MRFVQGCACVGVFFWVQFVWAIDYPEGMA